MAVALNNAVYLWNAATGGTELLMECSEGDNYVTSVKWAQDGNNIAIGTAHAEVQIWDAARQKQIRSLRSHAARVGALSWNRATLSTGSRDSLIIHHDVRSGP